MPCKIEKDVIELFYAIATQFPQLCYLSIVGRHFPFLTLTTIFKILKRYNTDNKCELFNFFFQTNLDTLVSVNTSNIGEFTFNTKIELMFYPFKDEILSQQFNHCKNWYLIPVIVHWLTKKKYMYIKDIVDALAKLELKDIKTNRPTFTYHYIQCICMDASDILIYPSFQSNYVQLHPEYEKNLNDDIKLPQHLNKIRHHSPKLLQLPPLMLYSEIMEIPVYQSKPVWCMGNLCQILQNNSTMLCVDDIKDFFDCKNILQSIQQWNKAKPVFIVIQYPNKTQYISMDANYDGPVTKSLKWNKIKYSLIRCNHKDMPILCKICFDDDDLVALKCGHIICATCMSKLEQFKCPFCTREIAVGEPYKLFL